MGVDEARHDDMSRRIDDGGVGRVNRGGDLDNGRPLDEHVADRVIADALVHRQHGSALDEGAPALDPDVFGHRGRRRAVRGFKIDGGAPPRARLDRERGEPQAAVRPNSRRGELTNLAHASLPGSAPLRSAALAKPYGARLGTSIHRAIRLRSYATATSEARQASLVRRGAVRNRCRNRLEAICAWPESRCEANKVDTYWSRPQSATGRTYR